MSRGRVILVRAGDAVHSMALSTRDVYLLHGKYFFKESSLYRAKLGLNLVSGLKPPPLDTPLVSHSTFSFTLLMQQLLQEFETVQDLISCDYSCNFGDEERNSRGSGGAGFRVEGGFGVISCRPAGYCDLTVCDIGPNGRSRIHTIIDMRVKREYPTIDRGTLRIYTRKATVGWFDELGELITFLLQRPEKTVEILHSEV